MAINHFDALSRAAVAAIALRAAEVEHVRSVNATELLSDPDADFLRTVAVSRRDPRIQYVVIKGTWRPVAWGALALPGATQRLNQAATFEFGPLPPLDGGLGAFDTPAWRRSQGSLFIGVAPSDFAETTTETYVPRLLTFVRIIERRLRLGIPASRRERGLSLPLVITRGNTCPRCAKPLQPMAVNCEHCGWSLSSDASGAIRETTMYPDGLADT